MKAIDALYEAQKISFSPFVFEATYTMLELGVLDCIQNHGKDGVSIKKMAEECSISEYGVLVLIEMAEAAGIVEKNGDDCYVNTKTGYFLARDEMTRVNLYFTHDVCYKGLFFLKESIQNGSPEGLKALGGWSTIYEGLSKLPDHIKKSWFEFDHFYSDNSFDNALKIIFKDQPKQIFDIGGNTGKWAIASAKHNANVKIKIFDLPGQIEVAKENINAIREIKDRIEYHIIDMLDPNSQIPAGADVYWMSQFLDCFSEHEIEQVLLKIRKNMSDGARVFIMETFIDNQRFQAATHSLAATSLYFTALANGNSKMYSSSAMKYIIDKAGFECISEHKLHEHKFHTILEIKVKD
ncbi:MAG: hypothetical protein ACI8ZM_005599 [Crocinitomix sp.]|jgi:hypothetical protein